MSGDDWGTRTLRAGVIGLGFTGNQHLLGYQALPNVEIVALAGLEDALRGQLAATYGVPNQYREWQDLLARDDLDLISVCTPNGLHAPIAIAALEGGRHVLCEKPLARTSEEAEAMVQAARGADRVLHTVFNRRARGDVSFLKRHIDEGGLGRIYHAKSYWKRRSGIPSLGSWFTSKEMAGGGPLIDLGVHMLDLALYFLGDPVAVRVSGATYSELGTRGRGNSASASKFIVGGSFEVEDLALAFIRFANGVTLELETSWAVYGEEQDDFGVILYGTEGGAKLHVVKYADTDTVSLFTDVAGQPAVVSPTVPKSEGHLKVVRDFVEIVRGGEWLHFHGEEGLRRNQIIDACYASARLGREVLIEEVAAGVE